MLKIKNSLMLLTMILVCGVAEIAVAENEWKLRKDKHNIQVYTRSVEGSPYDEVKAITVIQKAKLAPLVALIEDVGACAEWADKCAQSYVHQRVSDTEAFVYTHNEMPFPVTDRDVLAHVIWAQNPESYEVVMTSVATEGMIENVKGRLRLIKAQAEWRFKPLATGEVQIVNMAHIDPGSSLPGWVTNMLLVDTPLQTMKSFVAEAMKPKYQNATVKFIKELPAT